MIRVRRYFWKKLSHEWKEENIWLNPDHVVELGVVTKENQPDLFRGADIKKLTVIHTTQRRYYTTEPAQDLAKWFRSYPESKFTYRTVDV
tara:strand:- start:459 stop:728 length:270 start_codon:yes stop_codon:yes gene_type:complete